MPAGAGPLPRRARRAVLDLRRADARGLPARTCGASATRSPSRGASLNRAIADLPRLLGSSRPSPARSPTRTRSSRGSSASSATPRASSRRSPTATRTQFAAGGRHLRGLVARPGGAARRRSASRPRRSTRASRSFACSARSWPTSRPCRSPSNSAVAKLPRTLPRITPALAAGIPIQRRMPTLNRDLAGRPRRAGPPGQCTRARAARCAALQDTTAILNPLLRFVGPYVTVCNYFNYAFTHLGEHLTEPDPTGTSQRTLLIHAPRTVNPTDPSSARIGASQARPTASRRSTARG